MPLSVPQALLSALAWRGTLRSALMSNSRALGCSTGELVGNKPLKVPVRGQRAAFSSVRLGE